MTGAIKNAIENNPGRSMVVGFLLGLAFPYADLIPSDVLIAMLALNIFLSCYKINTPLRDALSAQMAIFYLLRFVLLPLLLWFACDAVAPSYALGMLLLALCPAGASSPAFTGLYNGNVALAFVLTIASSIGCVFLIPVLVGVLNHTHVTVSAYAILKTLFFCILLPGCVYLGLKRNHSLIKFSHRYNRFATVLIISVMVFLVVAKMRDFFLNHPQDVVKPFLAGAVVYSVAMLGFAIKARPDHRITYGVCSTFNNTIVGISLSLLYFDEITTLILIATELIWPLLPMFVQPILRRLPKAA